MLTQERAAELLKPLDSTFYPVERLRTAMLTYAKHPTDSNKAYMVGYITASCNAGVMDRKVYHNLLALVGQMYDDPKVAETVRSALNEQS